MVSTEVSVLGNIFNSEQKKGFYSVLLRTQAYKTYCMKDLEHDVWLQENKHKKKNNLEITHKQ